MKAVFCATLLAVFINPVVSYSQKGFGISARPSWVKPVPYSKIVSDTTNISGGYYYLLFDQQVNVEREETYFEIAIKVISDKGLSSASEVNESYDPAFQKLNFNSLYVLRGERKIDKLALKDFEVIRREENISRAMYDGSLSVINNLKDVKSGDIVCYSFTIAGFNPIVNGHFSRFFYINRGVATGKVGVRILASPSRKLTFKWSGDEMPLTEVKEGGLTAFSLEKENVAPVDYEDRVPEWHIYYNILQVTDFKDWDELSSWASTLFKKQARTSPSLKEFIDSLHSIQDGEERTLAAIRTIQDKVRYLSLSNGLNSYKPHSPSEVFDNKYGDCKDKSFLLSQVLTELGIESHPVLVHSDRGKSLDERLPAPGDFDHCIVQFKFNDSLYYVDPTITFQRGRLSQLYTPDYYFCVVADANQRGLTKIATPVVNHSLMRINEEFEVGGPGESVRLKVTTVYSGNEADMMRDTRNTSSVADLNKAYLDFYASDYPKIKMTKSVVFKDDAQKNQVTVEEEYNIPDFWQYDKDESQYKAKSSASVLSSYLNRPTTKSRHMPFSIRYPLDIEEVMIFRIPEEYNIENVDDHVRGPGFAFSSGSTYNNGALRLSYSYYNSRPFIDAVDTDEYLDKIGDVYSHLGYQFTHHKQISNARGTGERMTLIISGMILIGCIVGARRLYRYDPEPREFAQVYHDFNAILLLAIIGLSITPIKILISMAEGNFFTTTSEVLSNPGADTSLTIYTLLVVLINLALATLGVFSFLLAWNRRTSAPLFATVFYASNVAALGLTIAIGRILFGLYPEPADMRNLVIAVVLAAVCIPYFRFSPRAKGTFRSRLRY